MVLVIGPMLVSGLSRDGQSIVKPKYSDLCTARDREVNGREPSMQVPILGHEFVSCSVNRQKVFWHLRQNQILLAPNGLHAHCHSR